MSGHMKVQIVYCNHSEGGFQHGLAEAVREAVSYVEKHITEDITMYDVAEHVHVSAFYFYAECLESTLIRKWAMGGFSL